MMDAEEVKQQWKEDNSFEEEQELQLEDGGMHLLWRGEGEERFTWRDRCEERGKVESWKSEWLSEW